jgi:hypothetical protein
MTPRPTVPAAVIAIRIDYAVHASIERPRQSNAAKGRAFTLQDWDHRDVIQGNLITEAKMLSLPLTR